MRLAAIPVLLCLSPVAALAQGAAHDAGTAPPVPSMPPPGAQTTGTPAPAEKIAPSERHLGTTMPNPTAPPAASTHTQ